MRTAEDWLLAGARAALVELRADGAEERRMIEWRTASCRGKERYASAQLAAAVLRRRKRKRHNAALGTYRCQHCGGWHIGSPLNSTWRKRKSLDPALPDPPGR